MCDPSTVIQKSRYDLSAYSVPTPNGMVCTKCRRFTCVSCLTTIVGAIPVKHHDTWCKNVKDFLADTNVTKASFLGHCCELKTKRKVEIPKSLKTPSVCDTTLCDGDLFLPEFGLLLQTTFNAVDIHALAPDRTTKRSGAWHTTITMDDALQFQRDRLQPKAFPATTPDKRFSIQCRLPWAPGTMEKVSLCSLILFFCCFVSNLVNNFSLQYNVELYRLTQVAKFDIRRCGTNTITDSEFQNAVRYCGETHQDSCDITIITGEFDEDPTVQLLLLMRFHRVDPTELLSHVHIRKLYETLTRLCGKKGYEYKRTGGSSGRIEVTKELLKFINDKGTFPRAATSIKMLKNIKSLKWDCYYIGIESDLVKKVSYCNIKKGGSFRMPPELMSQYVFLQEFLSTKCKAALLLYELNASDLPFKIQPNAVMQEIRNLKRAQVFDYKFLQQAISAKRTISKKEYVMRYLSTMHRHTLVEHPVGFHIDVIKGQPVLENKVCFRLKHKTNDTGRGGSGIGTFVFALLDWPKKNQVRRAVYRALNGHRIIGERVTDWNWNSFIGMFGIEDIPDDEVATQEEIDERIAIAREQQANRHL